MTQTLSALPSWARSAAAVGAPTREPELDELSAPDLERYLQILTHSWAKILTLLGFTLIPVFFILDVFMMPQELLTRFGVYRGVTTVLVVLQFLVLRHTKPSRYGFVHGYIFSFAAGLCIALMTTDLGGFHSTYYAGLNLVVIAANLLLPWSFIHSAANSVLVIGLYLGCNLVFQQSDTLIPSLLVNNLYFMTGTAIISVSIGHVKTRLIRQEFFLRSDLKAARDALWGEMEVAKHIQTALLPKLPEVRGFQVAAFMEPATEVGGDYYDIVQTRAGETWLCIGDVSGHGVESGLIMMMAQTSLFTVVNQEAGLNPSAVLGRVNRVLRENIARLEADRYMTLTAIRLHQERMTFAGKHQDILVRRAKTGRIEELPTNGTWLGITDDLAPLLEDASTTLDPGDVILLFTDGVTEAKNAGGEMFGQERLTDTLARCASASAHEIAQTIRDEVRRFLARQDDDLTLVVVRRVGF